MNRKRRRKVTLADGVRAEVFDRTVEDAPFNAETATMKVDDPFTAGGRREQIRVTRSLRDDPLARLHARGQIGDPDYLAGRKWQELYERSEIGRLAGVDMAREAVETTRRIPSGTSDARLHAGRELGRLDRVLGSEGCALVRDVLAHRRFIDEVARRRGRDRRSDRDYLGRRFRECLATLALELGYMELGAGPEPAPEE